MEEINYIVVTDDRKVYGFKGFVELKEYLKELDRKGEKAKIWMEASDFVRELENIDRKWDEVNRALHSAQFHFITKLRKNGVQKNGRPRYVIPLTKETFNQTEGFDIAQKYEVLVFRPGTFDLRTSQPDTD